MARCLATHSERLSPHTTARPDPVLHRWVDEWRKLHAGFSRRRNDTWDAYMWNSQVGARAAAVLLLFCNQARARPVVDAACPCDRRRS